MLPIAALLYLVLLLVFVLHGRRRVGREILYGALLAAALVTIALVVERLERG